MKKTYRNSIFVNQHEIKRKFIMGGNQGHDYSNVTAYPLEILKSDFSGYENKSPCAYHRKAVR